jgi:Predicted glycosyltransferases
MSIDVAVFNYNGKDVLERTLRSVLASENVSVGNVYVIDDGSTDGSQKIVDKFDRVTLIQLAKNSKNLNLVRNAGLRVTKTDRVLLTDNDIEFLPNCLEELNLAMDEGKDIVAVAPRLLHMDDQERIFLDSCGFHYIGASTARYRGLLVKDIPQDLSPLPTMSGGIILVNKKIMPPDFSFDESIPFNWGCDGEFYYRMIFMGYKCLIYPKAVAYHLFKERTVERAEGHITTRLYMLLTYYSWKTLVLSIPAFILYEFLLFGFSWPNEFRTSTLNTIF